MTGASTSASHRRSAAAATERLTRALLDLTVRGARPPCSTDHELWLSEDEVERQVAVLLCIGCPVSVECGASAEANGERFGVWAGLDRSLRKHPQRAAQPTPDDASG